MANFPFQHTISKVIKICVCVSAILNSFCGHFAKFEPLSLPSLQMLDCITIPVVLFLSICILNVRYRWTHITGVVICMVGLGGLILVDALTGRSDHGGIVLILFGSCLF